MKRLFLIFLILAGLASSAAGQGRDRQFFRIGGEWGYGIGFLRYWNYNYMDADFGRIWDEGRDFFPSANAFACINIGADLAPWCKIFIQPGVMGVTKDRQVFSLGAAACFYPKGHEKDGLVLLAGGGIGFLTHIYNIPVNYAKVGAGWHLSLNRLWDMDLSARLRLCKDSPPIWDKDRNNYVNQDDIRGNLSLSCSLEFGVAIDF